VGIARHGPGQFNTPHGIAVGGSPPRVFVSDRGNRRIQVFDTDGKFLEEWPGIAPHSMLMSADEHVWAVDSLTDRIVKFDLSGHAEFSFGQFGTRPGYTWAPHQISADSGRQPVSLRSLRRTYAEVPAEARRGSDQARLGTIVDADGRPRTN
jgi:DNA-binding beta-propeller fold protein YncE